MKVIVFGVFCLISSSLALTVQNPTLRAVQGCSADVCSGSSCYCSALTSPIGVSQTPQLITLVYADAITDAMFQAYLRPLLEGRTNPDGVQIGASIYVPHEYTDYERVNYLYNLGLEIGVHSVSRHSLESYWQQASHETLVQEFSGQRQIISNFANIPIEDVIGAKMPNLIMIGDSMFDAYEEAGLEYDNSWTSRNINRYFPHTLDYLSSLPCEIGECPDESHSGFWEVPIVNLVGNGGIQCNSLQGCNIKGTASEVKNWLMEQFERVYNDNRAPITLVLSSGFFAASTENVPGLKLFLDELKNAYSDVFLVSHRQVVDWMKNPVPSSSFKTNVYNSAQSCAARTCPLKKGNEERYMKSCVACPSSYPWLGNPLGA